MGDWGVCAQSREAIEAVMRANDTARTNRQARRGIDPGFLMRILGIDLETVPAPYRAQLTSYVLNAYDASMMQQDDDEEEVDEGTEGGEMEMDSGGEQGDEEGEDGEEGDGSGEEGDDAEEDVFHAGEVGMSS